MQRPSSSLLKALQFAILAVALSPAHAGPVQALFVKEQASNQKLDRSYLNESFPAGSKVASLSAGATDLTVYVLASDITLAFDKPVFRVDAAIMPTNMDLQLSASFPLTQALLMRAIRTDPAAFGRLDSAAKAKGMLSMGSDTLTVDLNPDNKPTTAEKAYFPRLLCLIATDYPNGGSIARRDFFRFAKMASAVRACLRSLDALGAKSVVLPLIGSASGYTTPQMMKDDEKARGLLQCRMQNSLVGIALGTNEFLSDRKSIREIGIIQYKSDIEKQFSNGSSSQWDADGYAAFAESSEAFFVKALRGTPPKEGDLRKDVDCNGIFGFGPGTGTTR